MKEWYIFLRDLDFELKNRKWNGLQEHVIGEGRAKGKMSGNIGGDLMGVC